MNTCSGFRSAGSAAEAEGGAGFGSEGEETITGAVEVAGFDTGVGATGVLGGVNDVSDETEVTSTAGLTV